MAGIGREAVFGLDNFQKPKMLSLKDTIAQTIINILFMRPGNIPSMPHIGINLEQYLYALDGDFDGEQIKKEIYNQCSEVVRYVSFGEIRVFMTRYKEQDLLIVAIPLEGAGINDKLIIGASRTQDVNIAYEFEGIPAATE